MKYLLLITFSIQAYTVYAQDNKNCKDAEPAYINRMPGFNLSECKNSDYNEIEFIYYVNGNAIKLKKAGKHYNLWYRKNESETNQISGAQVKLNYFNAFTKIKGKTLSDDKSMLTGSINGKEVYLQLNTSVTNISSYHFDLIEVESMKQDIEINLGEAIDTDGKAALYGILFETGKSDIKPESSGVLKKIMEYLNANPSVKIYIVGHTDNTGEFAGNITLSKARAKAVKDYLVTNGKINAARLGSDGVGSLCPVSTNETEAGKSMNRRVEIVKQ